MLELTLADYILPAFLNCPPKEGAIGIEIEMELRAGNYNNWYQESKMWDVIKDGSLRLNGIEAVLKNPINIGDLDLALEDYQKAVKFCKMKFVENSRRTSVHVHINVQERRILDVYNIISCYWIVEPLLVAYSGQHRRGNNFCLSATEAEGAVFDICAGVSDGAHFRNMFGEENRYGALNIAALGKFGTLEFRSMRGVYDSETLRNWVNVIYDLTWKACGFKHPEDILSFMSKSGEEAFLELLFPDAFIYNAKKAYGNNWRDSMREGALSVLELASSTDNWEVTKEQEENAKKSLEIAKKRPAPKKKEGNIPAQERLVRRAIADAWIAENPRWDENKLDEARAHFVVWKWGIDGNPMWATEF